MAAHDLSVAATLFMEVKYGVTTVLLFVSVEALARNNAQPPAVPAVTGNGTSVPHRANGVLLLYVPCRPLGELQQQAQRRPDAPPTCRCRLRQALKVVGRYPAPMASGQLKKESP